MLGKAGSKEGRNFQGCVRALYKAARVVNPTLPPEFRDVKESNKVHWVKAFADELDPELTKDCCVLGLPCTLCCTSLTVDPMMDHDTMAANVVRKYQHGQGEAPPSHHEDSKSTGPQGPLNNFTTLGEGFSTKPRKGELEIHVAPPPQQQ